jgi:hypothetical protein
MAQRGVIPHQGYRALFNQIAAPVPAVYNTRLRLWTAHVGTLGYSSILSDIVEATFVGYAPSPSAPFFLSGDNITGRAVLNKGAVEFIAGALIGPQVVYGWYITDTAGTALLAVGQFDTPVTFDLVGDTLTVQAGFVDDGGADMVYQFISAGP